jgi:DNA-binding MarR family transcriptional regulator
LLDRRPSKADRRHLNLTLTAGGRRLVDTVMDHRRARVEALLERLSPPDRQALGASLTALAMAAAEADGSR